MVTRHFALHTVDLTGNMRQFNLIQWNFHMVLLSTSAVMFDNESSANIIFHSILYINFHTGIDMNAKGVIGYKYIILVLGMYTVSRYGYAHILRCDA